MKKQYALGILLLIAMGIVTTLAFQYNTNLTVNSDVYSVTDSGATGSITKVKVIPLSGNLNKTRITLTMTGQSVNCDIFITLQGADLTGITPASHITVSNGTPGDHVLADGYLEYTACDASSGTWTITIDATSGTGHQGSSVWQDTTGLLITVVDS